MAVNRCCIGARRAGTMSNVRHPTNYERSDVGPRLLAVLALGIAAFLLVTPYLLLIGYPFASSAGAVPPNLPQPPAPRLQVRPASDLERLRSYESAQLQAFGWIDRARGVVHIPIDRATESLANRGLPGWPSAQPPPSNAALP
jgi:hypothetical protein